ncbi:MAG: uridine diphosphate-N-acetylglucosamine-binding protein YvcK [Actinomycetota bacterium]|nr:uridine diphosphate-N-acetylglucosamine-binding protein YvcK [Actinomycetota bacterium]
MTFDAPTPQTLMQELALDSDGPHVVAIGGGHGLSKTLQAALTYAGTVDAIVSVSDDGGSSGRLVPGLDIPPPGDIRKCLLALTPDESTWKRIFAYRFDGADVGGHSLGNLILAALSEIEGGFEPAVLRAEVLLKTSGSVVPVCNEHLTLTADTDSGLVEGQVRIQQYRGKVDSLDVLPATAAASPRAIFAIESADQIILGPGSLLTSTIAALRVPGVTEAVNRSKAQLVYVANLITQDGETFGMDGMDHLDALLRLTGARPPGAIVANDHVIDVAQPLHSVAFDAEILATYGADLTTADLVDESEDWPSHDPQKLGNVLSTITR